MSEILANTLIVLDPTVDAVPINTAVAVRLDTLDDKVLGILENPRPSAEKLLDELARSIANRYNLAGIIKKRTTDQTKVAPKEIIDELANECHTAIVGLGD